VGKKIERGQKKRIISLWKRKRNGSDEKLFGGCPKGRVKGNGNAG